MKLPRQALEAVLKALLQIAFVGLLLHTPSWGMSFEKQERCVEGINPKCQTMILGVGQIDRETPSQFKAIAKDFPRGSWVAISSPGGDLMGGMLLGMAIRESGFNTTIGNTDFSPPDCLSACAYAFLGGISRKLPPGSRYGLHQFRGSQKAINADQAQKVSVALAQYLDAMGVDRRLLDYAQMTSSDKVAVLSIAQAQLLRVDTAGQTSYPRWKVEATPDSKLLVVNRGLLTMGSQIPVTLAFTPIPKQANKLALLIYYKSNDLDAFVASNPQKIQLGKKIYPLTLVGIWQTKTDGYQATFLMPESLQNALLQAPDDTVASLIGEFPRPPRSNSAIASTNPLMSYFGVGNLKNGLQALISPSN